MYFYIQHIYSNSSPCLSIATIFSTLWLICIHTVSFIFSFFFYFTAHFYTSTAALTQFTQQQQHHWGLILPRAGSLRHFCLCVCLCISVLWLGFMHECGYMLDWAEKIPEPMQLSPVPRCSQSRLRCSAPYQSHKFWLSAVPLVTNLPPPANPQPQVLSAWADRATIDPLSRSLHWQGQQNVTETNSACLSVQSGPMKVHFLHIIPVMSATVVRFNFFHIVCHSDTKQRVRTDTFVVIEVAFDGAADLHVFAPN